MKPAAGNIDVRAMNCPGTELDTVLQRVAGKRLGFHVLAEPADHIKPLLFERSDGYSHFSEGWSRFRIFGPAFEIRGRRVGQEWALLLVAPSAEFQEDPAWEKVPGNWTVGGDRDIKLAGLRSALENRFVDVQQPGLPDYPVPPGGDQSPVLLLRVREILRDGWPVLTHCCEVIPYGK